MTGRQALALGGFVLLGLSPSFVDWQDAPGKRLQIIGFYLIALALIWCGVLQT